MAEVEDHRLTAPRIVVQTIKSGRSPLTRPSHRPMATVIRSVFVVLIGFAGASQAAVPARPSTSTIRWDSNGHCYEAVRAPSGIDWPTARDAAIARGGYLATITSAEENAFVFSLVSGDPNLWYLDGAGNGEGPWFGGMQPPGSPEPAGGWQWDITNEPFAYTRWQPGEPNNFGGGEDRTVFFGGGTLIGDRWNDIGSGAQQKGYVIEWTNCPQPPDISVVPDTIDALLGIFQNISIPLEIRNQGAKALQWSIGFGNALSLDGADDYVNLGSLNPGSQWTLEAWVRPASVPDGRHTILGGMTDCNDWGIVVHGGVFGVTVRYSGCTTTHFSTIAPTPGTWYHIAGTNDGQNARLYVNGELAASGPVATNYVGTYAGTRIGGEICCGTNSFGGLVDDVRMWERALDVPEVRASMNGLLLTDPSLIGFWNFDESSGAVADLSGRGNNGSLQNGAQRVPIDRPASGWLSVTPLSGTTLGLGASSASVDVDARGQTAGVRRSRFFVDSDDPDTPRITVPVHVGFDAIPRITIDLDRLDFPPEFIGHADTAVVEIESSGTDVLRVSELGATGDFTLVDATPFDLLPGEMRDVLVIFLPSGAGERLGTLTIHSNAAEQSERTVALRGTGREAPRIVVPTDSLTVELAHGDSTTLSLPVSNQGAGTLSWRLRSDQAMAFDGADDYVNTGAWSPGAQWTVEAWIRVSTQSTGRRFVVGGVNDCRDWGIALYDGHIGGAIRPASGACSGSIVAADPAVVGVWHHVALVNDGAMAWLYIDGALTANGPVSAQYEATAAGTRIGGAYCCPGANFPGDIDNVGIWNRALLPDEVRARLQSEASGFESGLVGYWTFDEGEGAVAFDRSNHGHDGTLSGGPQRRVEQPLGASWFTTTPVTGTLEGPGTTPVLVGISARRLSAGWYTARVEVTSNDPGLPVIPVPLRARITGVPHVRVRPETLSFAATPMGSVGTSSIEVTNSGTEVLLVQAVRAGGEFLVPDSSGFALRAGESRAVSVQFVPSAAGLRTGVLRIVSDDPNDPEISRILTGTGTQIVTFQLDARRLERLGLMLRDAGMRPLAQIVGGASGLLSDSDGDSIWTADLENVAGGDIPYVFAIDPDGDGTGADPVFERERDEDPRRLAPVAEARIAAPVVAFDDLPLTGRTSGERAAVTRAFPAGNTAPAPFGDPGRETYAILDVEGLDRPALVAIRRYSTFTPRPAPGIAVVATNASWEVDICPAVAALSARFLIRYVAFTGIQEPTALRVLDGHPDGGDLAVLPTVLDLNQSTVGGSFTGTVGEGRHVLVLGSVSPLNPLAPAPPGTLASPTPADSATGVPLLPRLSWGPAARALDYDVYLWKADEPEPEVPSIASLSTVAVQLTTPLLYGVRYSWRVIARNLDGATESAIWTFVSDELPDLEATDLSGPATAVFGQTITVSWRVSNVGHRSTREDAWLDGLYLSPTPSYDPMTAAPLRTTDNSSSLGIGQGYKRSVTVRLPRGAVGQYYLLVRADAQERWPELREDNNVASLSISIAPPPVPDLIAGPLVLPSKAFTGSQMPVTWTVRNTGDGPTQSGGWTDALYFSVDDQLDTRRDTFLGQVRRTGNLDAAQTYTGAANVTIPRNISGTHYLFVLTDLHNEEYEFVFEGNNSAMESFTVLLTPPPDLVVSEIAGPTTAVSAQIIDVSWRVSNEGPGATFEGAWEDRVYLCPSPTFDRATAIHVGSFRHFGTLPRTEGYSAALSVAIPNALSGPVFVAIEADASRQVFEHVYEGNNVTVSSSELVVAAPDLEVTEVGGPDTGSSGATIALQWTVRNNGPGELVSRSFADRVYLSRSEALDAGNAIVLGTFPRHWTAGPGGTRTDGADLALPNGIEGTWFVHVVTDWDDRIGEAASLNNARAKGPVTVTLTPWPNLLADSPTVPDVLTAGENLSVTYGLRNSGTASVQTSWREELYVSASAIFQRDQATFISSRTRVGPLEAGGSVESEISGRVPINATPGTRYAHLVIDAANAIYEHTDEADNVTTSATFVLNAPPAADLAPGSLVSPAQAGSGTYLRLEWNVSNSGPGATLTTKWTDAAYLSADSALDPSSDYLLGSVVRRGALSSGGEYERRVDARLPNGTQGQFHVLVVSDLGRETNDGNRANDLLVSTPLAISLSPSPDLRVDRITAPASSFFGDSVVIDYALSNTGSASTVGVWNDAIFISNDATLDGSDLRLGSVEHREAISAGASLVSSATVFVPALPSAGVYYLLIRADSRDDLYEHSGEANNGSSREIYVGPPEPADLVVENASIPSDVVPGEPVTIGWEVVNVGVNRAVGYIRDAVYFSADESWSVEDPLAGARDRRIDLEPGERMVVHEIVRTTQVYAGNEQAEIRGPAPALTPGDYRVILRTNVRRTLTESDYANNDLIADGFVRATIPEIALGARDSIPIEGGQQRYFRVEIPESAAGQTLRITIEHQYPNVAQALYVRFGETPTLSIFDVQSTVPYRSEQDVVVGSASPGTYFALVNAVGGSSGGVAQIFARTVPFGLEQVLPSEGGAGGRVTLRILGAGFDIDQITSVTLRSAQAVHEAAAIYPISGTEIFATFDLAHATLGRYDVVVRQRKVSLDFFERPVEPFVMTIDSTETLLAAAFEVVTARREPLEIRMSLPEALRPGRYFEVTAYVRNNSNVDVANPHLTLRTIPDIQIGLKGAADLRFGPRVVTCRPLDGPLGVLRPGGTAVLRIGGSPSRPGRLTFVLRHPAGAGDAFDVYRELREQGIHLDNALVLRALQRLVPSLGVTWATYEAHMSTMANLMYREGRGIADPQRLLEYALEIEAGERDPQIAGEALRGAELPADLGVDFNQASVNTCTADEIARLRDILAAAGAFMDVRCPGEAGRLVGDFLSGTEVDPSFGPDSDVSQNIEVSPIYRLWFAQAEKQLRSDIASAIPPCPSDQPIVVPYRKEHQYKTTINNVTLSFTNPSPMHGACHPFWMIGGVNRDVVVTVAGTITMTPRPKQCGGFGCRPTFSGFVKVRIEDEYFFKPEDCNGRDPISRYKCVGHKYRQCELMEGRNHGFITKVYLRERDIPSWELRDPMRLECDNPCVENCDGPGTEVVGSVDPNDIVGPAGAGDERWVALTDSLDYVINFENDPDFATAPAQVVTIRQDLDPTVDARSLRLGRFGFAGLTFDVPPNVASYSSRLDVRDSLGLFVDVFGGVDVDRRQAFWTFRSIDSASGQPPADPRAGFLPINNVSPRGEGFVSYSVKASVDAPSGDTLHALARIVFDTNDPIDTPPIFNTIDALAPTSAVHKLPEVTRKLEFKVDWSGSDVGSGLERFDIYVRRDGGPYEPWLIRTTETEGLFEGVDGVVYDFYSIGIDAAGMREAPPGKPDATTRVTTTTDALVSFVDIDADENRVRVRWFAPSARAAVTLQRKEKLGDWKPIAELRPDGQGFLLYEDTSIMPGQEYGYRVAVIVAGKTLFEGEAWIVTPMPVLALHGARPNPAGKDLRVSFSLPAKSTANLELFDVSGRRILAVPVGHLGPGRHLVNLGQSMDIPSGTYWVRLRAGKDVLTARAVVVR